MRLLRTITQSLVSVTFDRSSTLHALFFDFKTESPFDHRSSDAAKLLKGTPAVTH
jgi:hypothetical protein